MATHKPEGLIFFDIPTTVGVPTSPWTYKVRLVLNAKKLTYQTCWVPISEIPDVCKSLGIPPTGTKPDGEAWYTLPALIDYTPSSGPVILADSTPILRYLDATYPSPPTPAANLFSAKAEQFHNEIFTPLFARILSLIYPLLVCHLHESKIPPDQVVFRLKREMMTGKTLEEADPKGETRLAQWEEAEKAIRELANVFKGPYLTGDSLIYTDFELAGWLIAFRHISPEECWNDHLAKWDGGLWTTYLARFEEWMEVRDDDGILASYKK